MPASSYLVCWIAAGLVALSPLPFASVDPLPAAILEIAVLAAALIWVLGRRASGLGALPARDPLLLGGALTLAWGMLQIVPMPISWLARISPATAALKLQLSPDPPAWAALSLNPWATWRSSLWLICWVLVALMVKHNAVDRRGRLVVAGGLAFGGLFQAAYGLFEFISGRQEILGVKKEFFTDVATGTFISRNNYAAYLAMAIPMALALSSLSLSRRASVAGDFGSDGSDTRPRRPLGSRVAGASGPQGFRALLWLLAAFLMGTAMLMSRSRMGLIAAGASLVAGGVVLALQGRARRFALAAVGVAALIALFASQIDILPVLDRFKQLSNEFGTGYGRLAVWKESLPLLAAYPLFGTGMGTWEVAFSPFRTDTAQMRVDFAHNDYLEYTAEAGFIGLILMGAATLLVLKRRRRGGIQDEIGLAAGIGLCAVALHSFVDFHMSIPATALTASVLAGLFLRDNGPLATERIAATRGAGTTSARSVPSRSSAAERETPALRTAGSAACVALLGALAASALCPAVSWAQASAAPDAAADDDAHDPLEGADTTRIEEQDPCAGCRLDPYNASRFIQAAGVERRRLLRDIEILARAHADGSMPDAATRQYLAGRLDGALELAHRGLSLSPASARGHMEAGMLRFGRFALTGLPPEASEDFDLMMRQFQQVIGLQPWRAASHARIAALLAPLYAQCASEHQMFIAQVTRRASGMQPWREDLKRAAAGMVL